MGNSRERFRRCIQDPHPKSRFSKRQRKRQSNVAGTANDDDFGRLSAELIEGADLFPIDRGQRALRSVKVARL